MEDEEGRDSPHPHRSLEGLMQRGSKDEVQNLPQMQTLEVSRGSSGSSSSNTQGNSHSKHYKWHRWGIVKHNDILSKGLCTWTIFLFVFVLLKALVYPGLDFCSMNSCGSLSPLAFDYITASFVGVCYIILIIGSVILLKCPGALVDHAFRNKSLALISLSLQLIGCVLLVGPIVNRGHVFSYGSVVPISISVSATEDDTVGSMHVAKFWSPMYEDEFGDRAVMIRVYRSVGTEDGLHDLHPLARVAWEDESKLSLMPTKEGFNRTQEVTGLKKGTSYMFTVQPATLFGDTLEPVQRPIRRLAQFVTLLGKEFKHHFVDFRAVVHCEWTPPTIICQ